MSKNTPSYLSSGSEEMKPKNLPLGHLHVIANYPQKAFITISTNGNITGDSDSSTFKNFFYIIELKGCLEKNALLRSSGLFARYPALPTPDITF